MSRAGAEKATDTGNFPLVDRASPAERTGLLRSGKIGGGRVLG